MSQLLTSSRREGKWQWGVVGGKSDEERFKAGDLVEEEFESGREEQGEPSLHPQAWLSCGMERMATTRERATGEVVILQRFRFQLEQDSEGDPQRAGWECVGILLLTD